MKAYGWFGLILLVVSEILLFRKVEPFHSWFYSFAWWSYILLGDNLLLRLRGRSLLTTRRGELRRMLPFSVSIWLLFEAYNFGIRNWAYQGVPSEPWLRWPGYALAFSTVLPGIFITSDLVECLLYRRPRTPFASECEPLARTARSSPSPPLLVAGAALSVAPLVLPRFFFPAVWVGPLFLLDPLLARVGLRSLSLSIADGDRRRAWSLLAGGLACGLLWEFWNFWAAARWVYSVPFFGAWKLFEMPVLGFLGFPPFALECWMLYHLLDAGAERARARGFSPVFWAGVALFSVAVLYGIDRRTVLSFVPHRMVR